MSTKSLIPVGIRNQFRDYKRQKKVKKYKGNAVLCVICKHEFSAFAPFGLKAKKRQNAQCHNCGSLERHRILWKYLHDELSLFKGDRKLRFLHFAPQIMFYDLFSKMDHIEYIPCDLFPEKYHYGNGAKVVKVDITAIPFDDNHFDFILCNHVLEHIPDDALAMSEMYRVMKKRGGGIFQVPMDYNLKETYEDFSITTPKEREKAFGRHDHVRWYGQDYGHRLAKAGFQVKEDDYVKQFSADELFKFGFKKGEFIYYCSK